MENLTISIPVIRKTEAEFDETERRLLEQAKEAATRSYSPYSHFSVGAAVLLADGQVIQGSNQENSAFPSGLCAERTAIFYANSRYPDTAVEAICIVARDQNGIFTSRPISPCGACRQVLVETETRYGHPMRIMLYGTEETYILSSARDTLPVHFDSSYL